MRDDGSHAVDETGDSRQGTPELSNVCSLARRIAMSRNIKGGHPLSGRDQRCDKGAKLRPPTFPAVNKQDRRRVRPVPSLQRQPIRQTLTMGLRDQFGFPARPIVPNGRRENLQRACGFRFRGEPRRGDGTRRIGNARGHRVIGVVHAFGRLEL